LRVDHSGAWVPLEGGSVTYKSSPGTVNWTAPTAMSVKEGGVWVNLDYDPYPYGAYALWDVGYWDITLWS
jgi:hypothetical protein